jgi:hypothetical protein
MHLPSGNLTIVVLFLLASLQLLVGFVIQAQTVGAMPLLQGILTKMSTDPFHLGLMLGFWFVSLPLLTSSRSRHLVIALSLATELLRLALKWHPAFIGVISSWGGISGLVGILVILVTGLTQRKQRSQAALAFCHAATVPIFYLGSSLLAQKLVFSGPVYDMYYYVADLQLGPPWGFTLTALTQRSFLFYTAGFLVYFFLSHLMAIASALWFWHRRGPNPILYYVTVASVGHLGYTQTAGVGPQNFFQHLFPHNPPSPLPPHVMDFPLHARRSAMPSLHMLWSYSIWAGALGAPVLFRYVSLAFVLSMPIATFLGPHYTVDILVSLGLAAPLHWVWIRHWTPRQSWLDWMCLTCLGCSVAYLIWILRGYSIWSVWPLTLQIPSLALLATCIYASSRIGKLTQAHYFSHDQRG